MLRVVVPKGSLEQGTLKLFDQADLTIERYREDGYGGYIEDDRIEKIVFFRAQEIPKYVAEGEFDLGIIGLDWIRETGADVIELADLPYTRSRTGTVKVVIAVDVEKGKRITKPEHIKPGSKVITEYPNLTSQYFKKLGIPIQIEYSYGITEAKLPEIADVIVDVVDTGETLRKHGGKVIGKILDSTTKLITNRKSYSDPKKREAIDNIKELLVGAFSARNVVLIKMNVPEDKIDTIVKLLPTKKSPTVTKLFNISDSWYAMETVTTRKEANQLIPELKSNGVTDILVLPLDKIIP